MAAHSSVLHPSLVQAARLAQPPDEEEVAENRFGALLGKFAAGLPQPMACEPRPQGKDRAVRTKGKQSCPFLWQLQLTLV